MLGAASQLLRTGKFEEASVDSIARGAGISRPSFYFYFASKDDLIVGVIRQALDQIVASLETALAAGSDPATPQALLRAVAQVWNEHGREMCAAIEIAPRSRDVFDQWVAIVEAPLEPLVDYLMENGTVAEAREREATLALTGILVWMVERNFYRAVSAGGSADELNDLADHLAVVLERTFGINGADRPAGAATGQRAVGTSRADAMQV